uniref:Uncharacterized protein n=1 Tax=Globodera rostochiensis TaxID=31243 RepID=A0A914HFP7_GLORO
MDFIGLVQRLFKFDNSNQNVKRMIIQLNVEVAKCDLFANVTDRAQKMENLCLMDSLLAHLLNNGTMFTAIGQWQKFLTEKQFYNNSAVPRPSDADRHWTKPECHKAEVVDSTQHKLFNTPQLTIWHTGVVLGHLVQKCPRFVQFVNKIVPTLSSISNYGKLSADERILFYKKMLGSTDTEAIKLAEGLLAIKTFFAEMNWMEQANFSAEKFDQIAIGRAELFGTFRMVKVEMPATFWRNEQHLNCFKTTA